MKNEKGLTLVETLIVSTLMFFVLMTAFSLIIHFGNSQRTELARTRLNEESRFMFNAFAEQLKGAGAILTLTHTSSFLGETPYFNGIFPLDKTDGPDGIIIASGDPDGVTALTDDLKSPYTAIKVENTKKSDGTYAWAAGDKGIVLSKDGYYVFKVKTVTDTELTASSTAVYYSGLLNNCGTYKYTDTSVTKGNAITYNGISGAPARTPVIRLTDFSIYLFDETKDERLNRNVNRLYRITDTTASSTPNLSASQEVVSDSIYDMQISYTFYPNFPQATSKYIFFGGASAPSPPGTETVYSAIQKRLLKEISVAIVVLTDQYGGSKSNLPDLNIPAVKNRAKYTLPPGKYKFKRYVFNVQNNNFNIVI